MAAKVDIGAEGLLCFPYGNGAERSLKNKELNAQLSGINFNMHNKGHIVRAVQEGIVFSFRYGLDVMKAMGMEFSVIRAGDSNLFQSEVFKEAFVNTCNVNLEIYNTDGAQGAARGSGIGIGLYQNQADAFKGLKVVDKLHPEPERVKKYEAIYQHWNTNLLELLKEN